MVFGIIGSNIPIDDFIEVVSTTVVATLISAAVALWLRSLQKKTMILSDYKIVSANNIVTPLLSIRAGDFFIPFFSYSQSSLK